MEEKTKGMEKEEDNYVSVNRELWNIRTKIHVESPYYKVREFLTNKSFHVLQQTELDLLEDLNQKRILHLQCHFGMDTLSLARLGAKHVTGVDLSNAAIDKARELAKETNLDEIVKFICCDIYDLEQHLSVEETTLFDIVFTSYGTTKWFPDLNKWAELIQRYLKIDGVFVIVDFHPMFWTFDDRYEHLASFSYFNHGPIVEYSKGTYTDQQAAIEHKLIRWNHSLADIFTVLLKNKLKIDVFKEFDSVPYDLPNMVKSSEDGQYRFKTFERKLPLSYAIRATKSIV